MLTLTQNEVFAGRYRVLRSLASGGMGAVYEVEHVETSRHHALKVLLPSLVDRQELRDRFKLEARITATIDSEAIVQIFDAGVDSDTGMPFLIMDLLRGEDLASVVAREGALPPSQVVNYLFQVACALDKTHDAKVVHRDLKPENLFIARKEDGSRQIKILDFGVAKLVVEGAAGASATTGFGTPLYMAPEQFKCTGVCACTDIYSLGMIAFTLLVGTPYWEPEVARRGTVFAFATLAVNGTRERASERARKMGTELPREFDPWFAKMTAVDPKDRYRRPTQAIEELARIFKVLLPARSGSSATTEEPVSTQIPKGPASEFAATQPGPPSSTEPRRRRATLSAAIALAAAIAIVAIGIAVRRQPATTPASAQSGTQPSASEPTPSATAEASSAPVASASPASASADAASVATTPLGIGGSSPAGGGTARQPVRGKPAVSPAVPSATPAPPIVDAGRSRYSRE